MEDSIAETPADDIEGIGIKLEPTKIAARSWWRSFGRGQRLDASKPEVCVTTLQATGMQIPCRRIVRQC